MIKLIGILIIIIGFMLKLDTIAVVLIAGVITGIVSGMDFTEVLSVLGKAFVDTRYMNLLLLTLGVVGILERNGLRERASICISKLKSATTGKVLSLYLILRMIASALSLRISGHVQFIRPLIYPMAKGAVEKDGKITDSLDEEIKGLTNASENYANFFGQNLFIASPGVLLIVGSLQELGAKVNAYDISIASIPIAIFTLIFSLIQFYSLDKRIEKNRKGER